MAYGITYLAGAANAGTELTRALSVALTEGATVFIAALCETSANTMSVADNLGNTYTKHGAGIEDTFNGGYAELYIARNVLGGVGTITITQGTAQFFLSGIAAQATGLSNSATIVTGHLLTVIATLGTDAYASSVMTPLGQPALVLGMGGSKTDIAVSAGTGMTSLGGIDGTVGDWVFLAEHKRVTSTTSTTAPFTQASGNRGVVLAVVVEESATTTASVNIVAIL